MLAKPPRRELLSDDARQGVGPYSGRSVHFAFMPDKKRIRDQRYAFEAQRHFGIITTGWQEQIHVGDSCTTSIRTCGWARLIPDGVGEKGWEKF